MTGRLEASAGFIVAYAARLSCANAGRTPWADPRRIDRAICPAFVAFRCWLSGPQRGTPSQSSSRAWPDNGHLAEDLPLAGLGGGLHAGLDAAQAGEGEDACLLHLGSADLSELVEDLGGHGLLQLALPM